MGLLMVNSLLFQNIGVLGFFFFLSFLNDSFTGNVFLFDLFLLRMSFWSLSFIVAIEKSVISACSIFVENLFFYLLIRWTYLCVIIYNWSGIDLILQCLISDLFECQRQSCPWDLSQNSVCNRSIAIINEF